MQHVTRRVTWVTASVIICDENLPLNIRALGLSQYCPCDKRVCRCFTSWPVSAHPGSHWSHAKWESSGWVTAWCSGQKKLIGSTHQKTSLSISCNVFTFIYFVTFSLDFTIGFHSKVQYTSTQSQLKLLCLISVPISIWSISDTLVKLVRPVLCTQASPDCTPVHCHSTPCRGSLLLQCTLMRC